ncbi:MAG: UDP-glucose 4-epimerase [Candidatus Cloacimonetes bacterium HGW-Cloacimonetes-2]|jgi:UDP-glucose 4-epimerase|nr:MAG: UDP-glucose 4-epimerase [Candidatus Cloacimonetes bacterium HGW-Cloacimonetes-2]
MKILITGGAGFIGSHVADAYLAAGHELVIVDNLSTGSMSNVPSCAKFYNLDIVSPELNAVFEAEKPDLVNHHAAQVSVPLSVREPLRDAQTNVFGLLNLLECCVKHSTKKIIYISSGGAIYGEADEYPTTENYNPQPLSVYAINKMAGESYLRFYHHQYGIDYVVLRYANVYGPRQVSHGEAGVVSIFIEQLLSGEIPTINAYPDAPEGMIRDYVFVSDAAKANLLALDYPHPDAFNIGTGKETTTTMLYNEINRQLGIAVEPKRAVPRQGDLSRSLLDCTKAHNELEWYPDYPLEKGISEAIEYFKKVKR